MFFSVKLNIVYFSECCGGFVGILVDEVGARSRFKERSFGGVRVLVFKFFFLCVFCFFFWGKLFW